MQILIMSITGEFSEEYLIPPCRRIFNNLFSIDIYLIYLNYALANLVFFMIVLVLFLKVR